MNDIDGTIDVYQTGLITWYWRAFGVLNHTRVSNNFITMAGAATTLGSGIAFTEWGARRKAQRALKYR